MKNGTSCIVNDDQVEGTLKVIKYLYINIVFCTICNLMFSAS